MIVDQLFDNKKNINEGLADEFMAMARAKGMNPRLRGTPDEERARTDAMMKQRAADRAAAPKPQPVDAETRAHLQDQLKSLEAQFDPQYEYSDNYSFWKEQSNIAQQIDRIKAALSRGMSEGLNEMDDDESYYEKYVRTKNLEGYETTPFGSVNDQRPQMPAVPQQDREAQEQARERQARISDFREKKRDLLQQFAQLGTLRTEMIHGLDNDVFLNKDQLIDFFEQQIDDPSLTALEYAYENNIPTDGLIRNILRRATQLGVSMLDVRKMFNQAKQKLGENIGRKVDAKGLTQGEWMQAVKQKFPDAKIVQAKMIDGPAHALLSDGRKIVWNPVQGVAEGYDTAEDYRAKAEWLRRELHLSPDEAWERAYDTDPDSWVGTPWEHDYKQGVAEVGQNFRRGNARRAALNAMSPEELKAHEEKRAEQQRKRDETRLERERQRNAAKKGVAEGLNEMDKSQKGAPGWNIGDDETGGKESYGKAVKAKDVAKKAGKVLDKAFDKTHSKKKIKESRQRQLYESMLMEDPVYRKFKTVGRYIAERKMTEKEILDVFAAAEKGMTDKGTGANRTMLGRGKDTTMDFAGGVADAVKGVLNSIQNSVPVAAVDVAYDQATDALANVAGGQSGPVMNAIKKYRMLAKEYPKAAGFAKAALVAIAGLATGGAGLPAIAGLTYALDSAIKGDKLSSVLGKGAGAAALSAAGQAVAGAMSPDVGQGLPPHPSAASDYGMGTYDPSAVPTPDLTTYTVKAGDNLSKIAAANNVEIGDIIGLNPQLADLQGASAGQMANPDVLPKGIELTLPAPADGPVNPYAGGWGTNADTMKQIAQGNMPDSAITQGLANKANAAAGQGLPSHPSAAGDYGMGGGAPIDYSQPGPISTDSLGQKLEYGMPVNDKGSFIPPNPNLPADELAAQQAAYNSWKSDFMKRFPNATQAADGTMQGIKPGLAPMYPTNYTPGMNTNGLVPKAVQESVKIKKLSVDKLIDQKTTVLSWALSESVGRKSKSVNLTTAGTYTVFENVDRYREAILEARLPSTGVGPGRGQLPDYYRPDMADAPVTPTEKPGLIGRGLNWLDKAAGKVGGALSNFGHQFTTNVTKEKLKMNWHQAGKPTDSDQLAAWLVKQGVPQDVVSSVYSGMGIPYTAAPAAEPAAATGGAQKQMAFYGTNPATGKPWTVDELQAKARAKQSAPTTGAEPAAEPSATQPTTMAAPAAAKPAASPAGFNAGNVMNLPGMEKYAKKPAPAKTPNFAGPSGYSSVTTSFKPTAKPTTATLPAGGGAGVKAAPTGTRVVSGGPTPDEQAKLAQRIAQAAKQPVAEMLAMVETKEDVQRIKQFIDQTFVKYGAVSESAFAVRNKLIEHVTQVGAQRRREFARKS